MFENEVWEEQSLKTLYKRVFTRLWDTHPDGVLAYSDPRGGPVQETEEVNRQFDALPGSHYLFMGYVPQYMLDDIQGILDELNMADDVLFVKYSTEED